MKNFWEKLDKPFFALAPMYDVTDIAFRQVVTLTHKPDVMFTEFVNCDGLLKSPKANFREKLMFTEDQRPMVAQIWGINPDTYRDAAKYVVDLGYDGIDINMGCPQRSEMKIGACAALINNHKLTTEIIEATIEGAGDIPVTVKTRIGVDKVVTEEWVSHLLTHDIKVLTIHGRTAKQMSKVPADWNEIKKAVELRNELGSKTLIVGNGDVANKTQGLELAKETGVDGIMIGRGIFTDLWAFSEKRHNPTEEEMLNLMLKHLDFYGEYYQENKKYDTIKKFYKIYTRDREDVKDFRSNLMQTKNIEEAKQLVNEKLDSLNS